MKCRDWLPIGTMLAATALSLPVARSADRETASEHRKGPNRMDGLTLNSPIPDHPGETFACKLVIAHNGRIVRRIDGDPLVWKWIYWDRGRPVAYEAGPMHFSMRCL